MDYDMTKDATRSNGGNSRFEMTCVLCSCAVARATAAATSVGAIGKRAYSSVESLSCEAETEPDDAALRTCGAEVDFLRRLAGGDNDDSGASTRSDGSVADYMASSAALPASALRDCR